MILFIVLGILGAAGVIGTIVVVMRDGYRRIPTDRSRIQSASVATPSQPQQSVSVRRGSEPRRATSRPTPAR